MAPADGAPARCSASGSASSRAARRPSRWPRASKEKSSSSPGLPGSPLRVAALVDSPLALVSGILLALSFPRYGHPAFAWIALAPLLVALSAGRPGARPARAFCLGFIDRRGVLRRHGLLDRRDVMRTFGGLSWPVGRARRRAAGRVPGAVSRAVCACRWRGCVDRSAPRALLLAPAVWVTTRAGAARYFWSGFPWVLLGYSQTTVLPVAQTGERGRRVRAVGARRARERGAWRICRWSVAARRCDVRWRRAAAGCVVARGGVGQLRGVERRRADRAGHAGPRRAVQGNIAAGREVEPAHAPARSSTRYLALTREAAAPGRAARDLARVVHAVLLRG